MFTTIILNPDALSLDADDNRQTGFRIGRDFRFPLGGRGWFGGSRSRVKLFPSLKPKKVTGHLAGRLLLCITICTA